MNRVGGYLLAAALAAFHSLNPKLLQAMPRQSSTSAPQEQVQRERNKPADTKAEHTSMKTVSLAGTVSTDGKTLVNDKDEKAWAVSNPDALKGYEGRKVKVKGHADAAKTEIQILSVKIRRAYGPIPKQP